ncbi:unnamed protein product [Meganyctiphanes norvegica]|uniref:Uncharacterized protein n=1 Tax=Meganyctiphanes norvegica TaxID=48144 RepID=A0AAV2QDR9_MEGNR
MPTFISQVPEMQARAEQIRLERLNAGDLMQADGPDPLPIIQQNAIMEAANEDLRHEIRYLREIQSRQVEALAQQQQRLQENLRTQREREVQEMEELSEQRDRLEQKKKELQRALDERAAVTEQVEVLKDRLQTRKRIYTYEVKRSEEEEEERKETLLRRQRLRMRHGFRSSYFWRYDDV